MIVSALLSTVVAVSMRALHSCLQHLGRMKSVRLRHRMSSVCPSLLVNICCGASLSKGTTLTGRLCERTGRRDCVKLESMHAEGTWYEGAWNDWCWKTPDLWSSSSSCSWTPQAGTQYPWTEHWERHSPWSNQWNPPFDITSKDPRQYGDGRGDVIPTFDGTTFRRYKRRVRLFVSNTRVAPERRAVKLLERLEEYYRTWKHWMVSRICLIT